jgi:hypothetical protein
MTRLFGFLLFFAATSTAFSQTGNDKYLSGGDLVARFSIHIVNGFLFVNVPIKDTLIDGTPDTVIKSFLIDPRASNDGSYLPKDSSETKLGTTTFYIPVSTQRTLVWKFAPSLAKSNFKKAEPSFGGVIGYGILRQYVSIINFDAKTFSLYSLEPAPTYAKKLETGALHIPYFDDVILNYCHCQFPTIWIEPDAAPLNPGRWHLSLADRQSVVYEQAIPGDIKRKINKALYEDSVKGKMDPYTGITLKKFELGGSDLVKLAPGRPIDNVPAIFKDLSVTVMGTVAMDIVSKFHALIIDPTRAKLMLCNY